MFAINGAGATGQPLAKEKRTSDLNVILYNNNPVYKCKARKLSRKQGKSLQALQPGRAPRLGSKAGVTQGKFATAKVR